MHCHRNNQPIGLYTIHRYSSSQAPYQRSGYRTGVNLLIVIVANDFISNSGFCKVCDLDHSR